MRAKVIRHVCESKLSLNAIHQRIAPLDDAQLASLLPPPTGTARDGVPMPPPAPTYPFRNWELVGLMDGLILMVDPQRGSALRRVAVADEIYRDYCMKPTVA